MFIILLGPPGAGKGTIAQHLKEDEGMVKISTGDILRTNVKNGTELGKKAKQYMDVGDLVPNDLVIQMISDTLTEAILAQGVIMDGYPRTIEQADSLKELLTNKNITISEVPLIEVEREEIIARLQSRLTCSNCQAIYNTRYNPPEKNGICDNCGGELITRSDQKRDVIENRLDVYEENTAPLVDYYGKMNLVKSYHHEDSHEIAKMIFNSISN